MVISKFDLDLGRRDYKQGNVDSINKFGSAPVVITTARDVWGFNGTQALIGRPAGALPVRIRLGGDANDTAAGSGTRSVMVIGVLASGSIGNEVIPTNGTLVSSPTSQSFWRIFRAFSLDHGTYGGTNDGDIVIENTSGLILNGILSDQGQSETSLFTIGSDREASILGARATVEGSKNVNLTMYRHLNYDDVSAPFGSTRILGTWKQLPEGTHDLLGPAAVGLAPWTDVWFSATTNAGTSAVSVVATYLVSDVMNDNILELT